MSTATRYITAEELFAMNDLGRCELVNGEIIHMSPAGFQHGTIASRLSRLISAYVETHQLGEVTAAETGFIIMRNPDTVRAPDIGFIRAAKIPSAPVTGFFPGPPDLAVEVISPNDSASEIETKVEEWLAAGTLSVWVIYPTTQSVLIYRTGNQSIRYRAAESVTDEPTLPGFRLELSTIFPTR